MDVARLRKLVEEKRESKKPRSRKGMDEIMYNSGGGQDWVNVLTDLLRLIPRAKVSASPRSLPSAIQKALKKIQTAEGYETTEEVIQHIWGRG